MAKKLEDSPPWMPGMYLAVASSGEDDEEADSNSEAESASASVRRRCKYIDDEAAETDDEGSDEESNEEVDETDSGADSKDSGSCSEGIISNACATQVQADIPLKLRFLEAFERLQWAHRSPLRSASPLREPLPVQPVSLPSTVESQTATVSDTGRRARRQSVRWETAVVDHEEGDEEEVIFRPRSSVKKQRRLVSDEDDEEEGLRFKGVKDRGGFQDGDHYASTIPDEQPEAGVTFDGEREDDPDEDHGRLNIPGWRETATPRRRLQPVTSSSEEADSEEGESERDRFQEPRRRNSRIRRKISRSLPKEDGRTADTAIELSSGDEGHVEGDLGGILQGLRDIRLGRREGERSNDELAQTNIEVVRAQEDTLYEDRSKCHADADENLDPNFLAQFYAGHAIENGSPKMSIKKTKTPKGSKGEMESGRRQVVSHMTPGKTPSQEGARDKVGSSTPAQRGRRDAVTRELFEDMNARIFENKLPHDLEIRWNARLNTTAGITVFQRSAGAYHGIHGFEVRVELSTKVLDDTYKLTQTLCHELCHVAAWVVNHTRKPPHGNAFKRWASLAGARYPGMEVTTCHNYDIAYKYRWQCQGCHMEYGRHSKSIDVDRSRCGRCHGRLAPLPRTLSDGTPAKRQHGAGGVYAQFVKANFKRVKDENPLLTPAQVMGKLGVLWKTRQQAGAGATCENIDADDGALDLAGDSREDATEDIHRGMAGLSVSSVSGSGIRGTSDDPFAFED